ncbi:hypothetical protein PR003_g10490 [Phytophthora rubi]|uniref:Uncharacterized protein n=1 Tax=Phytophthora rubi TaxID=129364 RepID=A0A6A3HU86_9STRA|nr:hypothetical protein PR002_g26474 [Phytophthora rubi]KAE8972987.1 hypothetical protein PR001_g26442 [Phytophthora rubi]KAE9340442.1 hypothetical protein PR003_g10490 [Phytophthora rubi]
MFGRVLMCPVMFYAQCASQDKQTAVKKCSVGQSCGKTGLLRDGLWCECAKKSMSL